MQPDSQDKPTVGATFATAREALGISPIEAADLLNLTQRTIEALEADDYESLPGRVYVNGYVRAYAKMLGLDADDLILRSAVLHGNADETPVNDDTKEPASRYYVNKMPISLTLKQWGCIAIGLVGLALFMSFFDDIPRPNNQPVDTARAAAQAGANNRTGSTASLISENVLDQPELDPTSLAAVPNGLIDAENVDMVIAKADVAEQVDAIADVQSSVERFGDGELVPAYLPDSILRDEAGEMIEVPGNSTVSQARDTALSISFGLESATETDREAARTESSVAIVAGESAVNEFKVPYFGVDETGARMLSLTGDEQLRFEFAADCWIEIRGADDVLLYADLGRAGQVRRFVGVGPFKLKIGFAEGVKLFFDAQAVDLAPYTRRQIARLELGR